MNINASYEKSTELLTLARQRGYPISALQLVRWHRAGLLPRPQQQPLKEARGTCSQLLRRIRKRIGREHFSTFLSRLLELAMEDNGKRASTADEHEQQLDLRILARGLGLEKRFVSRKDSLEYYLVQFLIPQLHWFFCWPQEVRWEDLLEHVTNFEVLQARDDLCTWLTRLENARQYRDRLPNDYPRWEIDLQEIFRALSTADQALVLVVWLALRTLSPSQLDKMPAIII